MNSRERILNVLKGKPVDRVPLGFWYHFLENPRVTLAEENEEIYNRNVTGHENFLKDYAGDIVKIMTDGFFHQPYPQALEIKHLSDFGEIEPIDKEHPWIRKQVELAKFVVDKQGADKAFFYNVFSPIQTLRIDLLYQHNEKLVNQKLAELLAEDPQGLKKVLAVYAKNLISLTEAVIQEGKVDGIYFSVNNISHPFITKEVYTEYIAPFELEVLQAAQKLSKYNLLHICGYHGNRNDISWYKDYPVAGVNWAVKVEGISLNEGRKIFPDKALIGGFGQTPQDIIYTGSKEELQQEVNSILTEAGTKRVVLGADCTIPPDTPLEHILWIKEAVEKFGNVKAGDEGVKN